jgi:hypothetical protein
MRFFFETADMVFHHNRCRNQSCISMPLQRSKVAVNRALHHAVSPSLLARDIVEDYFSI